MQHAIDAVPHPVFLLVRLHVDIAGSPPERLAQNDVDQFHYRGVSGSALQLVRDGRIKPAGRERPLDDDAVDHVRRRRFDRQARADGSVRLDRADRLIVRRVVAGLIDACDVQNRLDYRLARQASLIVVEPLLHVFPDLVSQRSGQAGEERPGRGMGDVRGLRRRGSAMISGGPER